MRKHYKSKARLFFISTLIIIGILIFLSQYPGEIVLIYGDRRFESAKVFEGDKLIGEMVWDNEANRAYAKDLRPLGQFSIQIGLDKYGIKKDSLKMVKRGGDFNFRVVTTDGKVFRKIYTNIEDLGYFTHKLESFELVKH